MRNVNSKTAPGRRDRERQQRREHILAAAERVFGRTPFDEASMQQIAAEAEMGMQGLYGHFSSKQALYESVVLHRLEALARQADASPSGKDPLARLRGLAVLYAGFFVEAPQFLSLYARHKLTYDWGLQSRFSSQLDRALGREEKRVARALDGAVAAGALLPLDRRLLADLATAIFQAVMAHRVLREREGGVEECADRMIALFLKGAGAAP